MEIGNLFEGLRFKSERLIKLVGSVLRFFRPLFVAKVVFLVDCQEIFPLNVKEDERDAVFFVVHCQIFVLNRFKKEHCVGRLRGEPRDSGDIQVGAFRADNELRVQMHGKLNLFASLRPFVHFEITANERIIDAFEP